jgi:LPS O-antigen subunit length determinant protein (WzzB/FepE family)
MAPAVPHICEELYQGEGPEGSFVSHQRFDRSRPFSQYIDKHNETIQSMPLELVGLVGIEITKRKKGIQMAKTVKDKSYNGEIRDDKSIEQKNDVAPLRIQIVQACEQMFSFFDSLRQALQAASSAEVMKLMLEKVPDKDWEKFVKYFVPRTLGADGLQAYLTKEEERTFLVEVAAPFLRAEFSDAEVFVTDADDVESKNRNALPGSPAIVLL